MVTTGSGKNVGTRTMRISRKRNRRDVNTAGVRYLESHLGQVKKTLVLGLGTRLFAPTPQTEKMVCESGSIAAVRPDVPAITQIMGQPHSRNAGTHRTSISTI
jgi:hypothetical protein